MPDGVEGSILVAARLSGNEMKTEAENERDRGDREEEEGPDRPSKCPMIRAVSVKLYRHRRNRTKEHDKFELNE